MIVFLLLAHGKPYYALGAYPILFAFGAWHLEQLTSRLHRKTSFIAGRSLLVLIPVATGYWLIPIALPVTPPAQLAAFYERRHVARLGVLRWEDQKDHPLPQDFADMLGWKEMAQKAAWAYASLDSSEKRHLLLFCDNYGEAGALNYYGRQYGLPETYSDNASFMYWLPDSVHVDNLLLVTADKQEMEHPFVKDFSSAIVTDSVTNPYAREKGSLILIFKHANEKMQRYFRDKIAADKTKISGR